MDDNTAASNPGRVRVNYYRWAKAFPLEPIVIGVSLLTCVLLNIFVSPGFWILLVFCGAVTNFRITGIREHLLCGCLNPSIVVSANPPLVAVCTDLRTGETRYSVIKVLRQPLHRTKNGIPTIGTRLATVATYWGRENSRGPNGHWGDFKPIAVSCVSDDTFLTDHLVDTIPANDWEALTIGLEQLPQPIRPGLYPIVLPNTSYFD